MKITIFQLKSNPEIGFSIQEDFENKWDSKLQQSIKTKNKSYNLWVDTYEGGEAYETDWDHIDEFKSFDDAMNYILENHGEVEKIGVY
jgi:hypothetical protein